MPVQFSPARAVTPEPHHHFFGYYGICPWSASQQYLVCLESTFQDHPPEADETATLGLVHFPDQTWTPLVSTSAWNLQQGAMLHWMPTAPDSEIIFNDREDAVPMARIMNIHTRETRALPRPVSAVSHTGAIAASLNYGRMFRCRRVVGYAGASDHTEGVLQPEDDGLYILDLKTGGTELIATMSQVFHKFDHPEEMADHPMWFNHVCFNPSDTRVFFLARYRRPGSGLNSAMFTVGTDGSDLRKVIEYDRGVSHFEWRSDTEILVTVSGPGGQGRDFVLFTDGEQNHRSLSQHLRSEGHPCFSPDGRWLLSDEKPRADLRRLRLYDMETDTLTVLGEYAADPFYRDDIRCDLHPRWNRTGNAICFDSIHETHRQVYVIDLELS